jgi:uncharacterized protein YgfB (UPF0149 family)
MNRGVHHDELESALRQCGASWNASQAHGFLCSRIAVQGTGARTGWLNQLSSDAEKDSARTRECVAVLDALFTFTWRQLAERQSEFVPLLPEEVRPAAERAAALAHWCEGFLHGLVSGPHPEPLRARLATEPLSELIRDMLELTRAAADDDGDDESNEEAYVELVEYIRVAAQLAFEELAEFRARDAAGPGQDAVHQ